jgi:lysophospholipase L1-like esterase
MNLRSVLPVLTATLMTLRAGDFALHNGDTVAFLGDSITAARGYTKFVELYTLMRFPDRRVRFINAGQGGDTAHGCLQRLDRDVFAPRATILTVAFGINDIGWGTKADDAHRQLYLDGIREIVTRSRQRGVRVFICSPAITAEAPETAEKGYLQLMVDDGMALARSLGAETIDLARGMREVQRRVIAANASEKDPKNLTRLHTDDGVHLNDLGQLAMGHAMLRGLGAPAEVSSVILDSSALKTVVSANCSVSSLNRLPDGISFLRLDRGLPVNLGIFGALNYRWIPIPETLNGYRLQVTGLEPGEYEVRVERRLLGRYSAERLSQGENIASATANGWEPGGPWDAQSDAVRELVDARDKAWGGEHFRRQFNDDNPLSPKLRRQAQAADDALVTLARSTAKPYPYLFEIRRVPPKTPAAESKP